MGESPRHALARAILVLASAILPTAAPADEEATDPGRLSASAEIDVVSRYVWRALAYSEGVVAQPSVTLALGTMEFNLWANVDPSLSGSERLNEVDYSAAWNVALGPFEAKPSVVLYTYPKHGEASTGEMQIELRRSLPGGWGAFVRHSADVFDYPGASFTIVGVDREWEFESGGALSLSAQAGRGSQGFSDAYLPGGPALSVAGLGVSWTVPVIRGWSVRPHVDWLEVVDADARAMLPEHVPLTFGIALGRL